MTFNLSKEMCSESYWDKEGETQPTEYSFRLKDVKEFIRLLKEGIDMSVPHAKNIGDIWEVIDKLAGDELI